MTEARDSAGPSIIAVVGDGTSHDWLEPLEGLGAAVERVDPLELAAHLEGGPARLLIAPPSSLTAAAGVLREQRERGTPAGASILVRIGGAEAAQRVAAEERADAWLDPDSPAFPEQLGRLIAAARHPLRIVERMAARLDSETWSNELLEYLVHDLKNPLGTVLTNLQLLQPRIEGDPLAQRLVSEARRATQRLEGMVLDLLDVGRLSAGELDLCLISVPLEDLVEEALASARPAADASSVSLVVHLGEAGDALVRVDFDLMTRVLVNLLDNAIRHSPRGGEVRLSVDEGADGRRLVISDQGVGVPEAWRERIFERFVQRGAGGPGRVGRGLGLAFAKLVALAHGLPIGVEPGVPTGSRFFIGVDLDPPPSA